MIFSCSLSVSSAISVVKAFSVPVATTFATFTQALSPRLAIPRIMPHAGIATPNLPPF